MRRCLFDTYRQVSQTQQEDQLKFFRLLNEHIDWDDIIPARFYTASIKSWGKRKYQLESFIKALVLQDIFGYVEDTQLLNTLRHSKEMRDFCGFANAVPDASKITRFKQDFGIYLQEIFDRLVDITDPICRAMDAELADCLISDTTGIESYVTENNPKFMSTKAPPCKSAY